jgi:hypothetical protein
MKENLKEVGSGIVHLSDSSGEFTLCGYAFDAPATESEFDDDHHMIDTDEVVTCNDCIRIAKSYIKYFRREFRKMERNF